MIWIDHETIERMREAFKAGAEWRSRTPRHVDPDDGDYAFESWLRDNSDRPTAD